MRTQPSWPVTIHLLTLIVVCHYPATKISSERRDHFLGADAFRFSSRCFRSGQSEQGAFSFATFSSSASCSTFSSAK